MNALTRTASAGLALLLFAAAGCSSDSERKPSQPDVADLKGKRAAIDQQVPDFCLRDLTRDGDALVSLSEHRGRAVVLFFMSYN